MKRVHVAVGCLALLAGVLHGDEPGRTAKELPPAAARAVDFRRDVQPILARSCVSCHGPARQRGGLRLDDGAEAAKGGNSGPALKPGDARGSKLLLAVAGLDPDLTMPPKGKKPLTREEIGLLRAWIEQGAKWPRDGGTSAGQRPASKHWAYQPIKRPALPTVKNTAWVRNEIDAFVLARLEAEGIAPSPEADRATLLRRLSLDLLGLPPTPEEVDAVLGDRSPDWYERLVGRLLASPHYGERWGRHWLDLARYADSDGYEKDTGRPHAWRYRQWVIDALNRDLPFDEFTVEQLAGDLLPGATTEQKVATGFHRNTLTNREGGVDREQFRVEQVIDRVNTTAKVWLGQTLGCAQCHDHKYDPFTQRDYYQFFAFFNSDVEKDIRAPLPGEPDRPAPPKDAPKGKKGVQGVSMAQTLALGPPRKTHVLIRGDFLRPGVEVQPETPAVLPPLRGSATPTRLDLARWIVSPENPLTARVAVNWAWHKYFGRGLVATLEDFGTQGEKPSHPELLDWLAAEFMASGGVYARRDQLGGSPGASGGVYARRAWGLKRLHRLIVTSATYRQSSKARPGLRDRDPLNALLARQNRTRLEAEVIRDVALASSGLLTRKIGGPSVRPPQPPGISELTYAGSAKWVESTGPDRYRRGLYTWFQRTSPYPMLMTFDAPDSNVCCVRRERSNTPLQALTLMNDTVFVECAQAMGKRILADVPAPSATQGRVRHGFRLCLGREPSATELARLVRLHGELRTLCQERPAEAAKLLGKGKPAGADAAEAAAWVAVARALLNLDEFVTRE
ncbi:MAG TPA: PSD1 and planctomycete cytochrome C domain-containing protein [Gemmataceae bacterium]|nr:PSD1 and planctomycete cytochrome C domain-containing protein [Gemmataceae bacterium]